jgi:hypothetical protein
MSQIEVRREAHLVEIQAAEHKLMRSVGKAVVIAIPICVVIWIGIVLLALELADWSGSWVSTICIGAVVGVFAAMFFGMWAGALIAAHDLDAADSHRD